MHLVADEIEELFGTSTRTRPQLLDDVVNLVPRFAAGPSQLAQRVFEVGSRHLGE
jgi:hypothetical protein